MARVRLEIDQVTIHRPKRKWRLYFVVVTEHPAEPEKLVLSVIPHNSILVVPDQQNTIFFQSEGSGTNGLHVLSRAIPENKELNVHLYVMHSRRSVNEIGKLLKDIEKGIGGQALGLVTDILGTTTPWLTIARRALPLVGQIMENTPDRNLGFINMYERFGPNSGTRQNLTERHVAVMLQSYIAGLSAGEERQFLRVNRPVISRPNK